MVAKKQQKIWHQRFINAFGMLLYVSVLVQWIVSVALFSQLFVNLAEITPVAPQHDVIIVEPAAPSEPTVFTYFIAATAVVLVLGMTVWVLARIPSTIVKTGKTVVHTSSKAVTTAVIKASHKKDTKKVRDRLTPRITFYSKLAFIAIPVVLAFCSRFLENSFLDETIALFVAGFLASVSIVLFALQYGIAWATKTKPTDIW